MKCADTPFRAIEATEQVSSLPPIKAFGGRLQWGVIPPLNNMDSCIRGTERGGLGPWPGANDKSGAKQRLQARIKLEMMAAALAEAERDALVAHNGFQAPNPHE